MSKSPDSKLDQAEALLVAMRESGFVVQLLGGRDYSVWPVHKMTPELKERMRKLKPEIIELLRQEDGNSWAESRNFWPQDRLLRKWGFRIYARPKDGHALWVREWSMDARHYTQAAALRFIQERQEEMKQQGAA